MIVYNEKRLKKTETEEKEDQGACEYEKQQNTETQKKRGSTLLLLVLFMCVLAMVVAVILVSSPAVDAQYKTVGCMVIDKKNAVIAAMAAVFCGIAGFVIRHHAAR
ncbi:MAG: hypothetical protein ACLSHV_10640 [Hominisplanchenecus sp.]